MKTFRQFMNEVEEPRSEDEKAFKVKHVIQKHDYPVDGTEDQFVAKTDKKPRPADYVDDEDKEVYESAIKRVIRNKFKLAEVFKGVEPHGGDFGDDEDSHVEYKKGNLKQSEKPDDPVWPKPLEPVGGKFGSTSTTFASYKAQNNRSDEKLEDEHLTEGARLDLSRHERSHGKKRPRGYGTWFFTTMERGEPDEGEYRTFSGNFSVASKQAREWAFKKGAHTVYLMEDVNEDGHAYAQGMAAAKEIHDDEPPLEKKTIKTAHKIAKRILANEAKSPEALRLAAIRAAMKTPQPNRPTKNKKVGPKFGDSDPKSYRAYPLKEEDVLVEGRGNSPRWGVEKVPSVWIHKMPSSMSNSITGYEMNKDGRREIDRFEFNRKLNQSEINLLSSITGKHVNLIFVQGKSFQYSAKPLNEGTKSFGQFIAEAYQLLDENFKQGSLKLKDGSSVSVSRQDASLLNQMFKDLNPGNKKRMMDVAMTDKAGFEEILGFAKEAL
ncbi:MAG: hypothetical protein WCY93_11420 [Anaerolineaceae bacterium]